MLVACTRSTCCPSATAGAPATHIALRYSTTGSWHDQILVVIDGGFGDDGPELNMRSPFVHNELTKYKNIAVRVKELAQRLELPDQALDAAMLGLAGRWRAP
jgi:hypothetical protein